MNETGTSTITPTEAADVAASLADTSEEHLSRPPVRVLSYEPGATLVRRREAFRPVYEAIVARIGRPTLLGGSAHGPDIRWRDEDRLVVLSGDIRGVTLSVHVTQEREEDEYRAFEWGGAWSADERHDFDSLPYLWQLYRNGPGEGLTVWPGGRLAACWEHFESALALMAGAWAEQLPVQIPGDWATFSIRDSRGSSYLSVHHTPEEGLGIHLNPRGEQDAPEDDMRARGWQTLDNGRWTASFPDTRPDAPAALARLAVAELRAQGVTELDELTAGDISANDYGHFWLPGLGITTR
ncbi:hypothetical protein ACLGI4_07980 [Streptomyces sp. HMX112]|uniref:hypothetical protein n=1 Tax=Streptomyces sp. HMX112 TaxID=3390850 RepID=UPI003A809281